MKDNLVIALQPDRGARADRYESYHDMQRAPRHAYVAFYLWLRHVFAIDALHRNGRAKFVAEFKIDYFTNPIFDVALCYQARLIWVLEL